MKIEFEFENCEVMEFPVSVIGDLLISDIETSVKRYACNAIGKRTVAHEVTIEIFVEGNGDTGRLGLTIRSG